MLQVSDERAGEHGPQSRAIFWIAIAFSTFQIITAAISPLSSLVVRSVHVGFLCLLIFAFYADSRGGRRIALLDWLLGGLAFSLAFYHWVFEGDIILRSGDPNTVDLIVGSATVLLVFEAARRVMGAALPAICAAFVLYSLFGEYLPPPLQHRGYGVDQVVNQLYLGTEGIYGIPAYVSSTYIFLFILFGSFLEQAGMIKLFNDVAMGTVGHTRGGPAKVAVVSSALMGTINGSGVANVVTDGTFTIPLMKRFGFSAAFSGAVEATASMGGQIMPPVMGAVAFIMAESLNISYYEVCKAAAIPALLYFLTVFVMVHFEAGRLGLHGVPKEDCPSAWKAFKEQWHLTLPLAVLVMLLFGGYTPMYSGTIGMSLTVIVILGTAVSARLGGRALRLFFWIVLGFAASAFFKLGIGAVAAVVGTLIVACWFVKGGREVLRLTVNGLVEGAKSAVSVGIACALVGTIIATMTLTGLAGTIAQAIISMAASSLFLSLFFTMLTSLLLGMGIPTIPNYIITSSLVAPTLFNLGVPLVISHMFVFYFGIMADLTPPVALAAFAAAPIARASGLAIGIQCMRIAVAGFVVPYMAVYDNALMLQTDDVGAVLYVVTKAVLAIGLWAAASVGYALTHLTWPERIVATLAAAFLVAAIPVTDEIGFAMAAVVGGWHWWRSRRVAQAA